MGGTVTVLRPGFTRHRKLRLVGDVAPLLQGILLHQTHCYSYRCPRAPEWTRNGQHSSWEVTRLPTYRMHQPIDHELTFILSLDARKLFEPRRGHILGASRKNMILLVFPVRPTGTPDKTGAVLYGQCSQGIIVPRRPEGLSELGHMYYQKGAAANSQRHEKKEALSTKVKWFAATGIER